MPPLHTTTLILLLSSAVQSVPLPGPDFDAEAVSAASLPARPSPSVNVTFGIEPQGCLDLDPMNVLSARLWITYVWQDERMAFDVAREEPKRRLDPAAIWMPDIALYNRLDSWNPMFPYRSPGHSPGVILDGDGVLTFIDDTQVQVQCDDASLSNLSSLPSLHSEAHLWTPVTCHLKFGSWTHDGNELDLAADSIRADSVYDNCPTKMMSFYVTRNVMKHDCCPEPYVDLTYTFELERQFVVDASTGAIVQNPRSNALASEAETEHGAQANGHPQEFSF